MKRRALELLGIPTLVLLMGVACAPQTVTRRSAFVPAPAPPDFSGRVVPQRKFEISGAATPLYIGVETRIPAIGDAGLYVPNTQYQVAIRYGFGSGIDAGLLGHWAPWIAREASAFGVPPLPGGGDVFGFGFAIRGGWPVGNGLRVGFALEATSRFVPYSVWQCPTCDNDYSFREGVYELKETGREPFWTYSLAGVLGWDLGPLTPFLSITFASTIRNVGFDPTLSVESTLESGGLMTMIGAGLEARIGMFRLMGLMYFPIQRDPVSYLPIAVSLSVGLIL